MNWIVKFSLGTRTKPWVKFAAVGAFFLGMTVLQALAQTPPANQPPTGPANKQSNQGSDPKLTLQVRILDGAGVELPYATPTPVPAGQPTPTPTPTPAAEGTPVPWGTYTVAKWAVAVPQTLKAELVNPPAGLKNVKYKWSITNAIESYTHDIDDDKALTSVPLGTEQQKTPSISDIVFYFKKAGANTVKVTVTADGGFTGEKTITLTAILERDTNRWVYGDDSITNHAGFATIPGHHAWHGGATVDTGIPPGSTPGSSAANDTDAVWGSKRNQYGEPNGRAFLVWHGYYIRSHYRWRDFFGLSGVTGTAKGTPPRPPYLYVNPATEKKPWDNNLGGQPSWFSDTWTDTRTGKVYTKLGDFEDLYVIGKAIEFNWHGYGHGRIRQATGFVDMANFDSPRTEDDTFWKWHGNYIDQVLQEWGAATGKPIK